MRCEGRGEGFRRNQHCRKKVGGGGEVPQALPLCGPWNREATNSTDMHVHVHAYVCRLIFISGYKPESKFSVKNS